MSKSAPPDRRTSAVAGHLRCHDRSSTPPNSGKPEMPPITSLHCACGQVRLETVGTPITCAECHCNSCRAAAARLQVLPGAPRIQASNGGTHFVLYRKD